MNTHTSTRRTAAAGLLITIACALATACGSDKTDDAASTRSYVGTAQGTSALVAVVVDGTRVQAYVCDGMPGEPVGTAPTVQAWWNGTSDGRTVDVQQVAGRLRVELTDTQMTGTLTLADGRALAVTGQAAKKDAGLYRAEAAGADGKAVAGWILAADGAQRGGTESGTIKLSEVRKLNLSEPTFTLQGLATARISKVGITPIPIP